MSDRQNAVTRTGALTPSAMHRKQMRTQVWLPMGLAILVALALMVLAVIGALRASPQIDRWGAISAILVILPVLVTLVVLLAIIGGLAYLESKLLGKLPGWMLTAQLFMLQVALTVRRASNAATKPVFASNTFSARVQTLWDTIRDAVRGTIFRRR